MKCKVFCGPWFDVMDAFNTWAKGKMLTKNVIIHTIYLPIKDDRTEYCMAIIVYHPDDPFWDKPVEQ